MRRVYLTLLSLVVIATGLVISATSAQATDTSGFSPTSRLETFTALGERTTTVSLKCLAGTTPLAGGLANWTGAYKPIYHYADIVNWGDGAGVTESVDNTDYVPRYSIPMYVSCAPTSWLHDAGRVVSIFSEDNTSKHAGGYASCPAGSIALSAGVYWNDSTAHQSIDYSGPTADHKGWFVTGTSTGTGNYMTIDLRCINLGDFPGAYLVQSTWQNTISSSPTGQRLTASCPTGMALLNGGIYTLEYDGTAPINANLGSAYENHPDAAHSAWVAGATVPYMDTMHVSAWCVPNQKPILTIVSAPPTYSASGTASISFAATDPSSNDDYYDYTLSYDCGVDGGGMAPCISPWTTTVSEGQHVLVLEVKTSDGRTAYGLSNFFYDPTSPTVTMTAPTAPFSLTSPVSVGWGGSDGAGSGVSRYNVRYNQAPDTGSVGTWMHPAAWQHTAAAAVTSSLAPGVTQRYSAQAVDRAGNKSVYPPAKCIAIPIDDTALNASTGWTRVNDAAYWNGTYTATTTQNATLALPGVHLDRVGIVADTCPTCGQLAILVGTTQIGTINLHSTSTQHQVVHVLPKFTAATVGTVTIKVLTSRKTVTIDGLAVSQH